MTIRTIYSDDWFQREFISGTSLIETSRRLITQHAMIGNRLISNCVWPRYRIQSILNLSEDKIETLFAGWTKNKGFQRHIESINATKQPHDQSPSPELKRFAIITPEKAFELLDEWALHKSDHGKAITDREYWVRKYSRYNKHDYNEILKRTRRDSAMLRKRITESAFAGRDFRIVLNIGNNAILMHLLQKYDNGYWLTEQTSHVVAVVNESQRQMIHNIRDGKGSIISMEFALKVLDIVDE